MTPDDELMAIAAVRYCLSRHSYIVSACCNWVLSHEREMSRNTCRVILRDIVERLQGQMDGDWDVDRRSWHELGNRMLERMDESDK